MRCEMAAGDALLDGLTAEERGRLEAALVEVGLAWDEGQLGARLNAFPPGTPLRRAALVELVKVDLERQWQRGRRPALAVYLRDYPELGTAATLPAGLIRAEYEVRCQFGAAGTP